MKQLKRTASLFLALFLILTGAPSSASASSLPSGQYFTALNDKLLPLSASSMPVLVKTSRSSTLYIPISLFDSRATGVDLGVYCGGDGKPTATLYSRSQSLLFNLDDGTTFAGDGEQKLCMALWRSNRVYVPANWVCSFFGLSCALLTTDYGDLVRITNGQEGLDNAGFVDAAPNHMQYSLNEYYKSQPSDVIRPPAVSPEPAAPSPSIPTPAAPSLPPAVSTPTPVPSTPLPEESPEPDSDTIQVGLAFRCTEGDVDALLSTLDSLEQPALLLFDPGQLRERAAQVRRAVASGHTVGFTLPEGSLEESRTALAEGNRLLQGICCARARVVEVPAGDQAAALEQEGWRCWSSQVDATGSESLSASALYRTLTQYSGVVRLTMAPSAGSILGALSSRLSGGDHTVYTPTESVL